MGLKCLRTSWKRDGGGGKRWDGGKETSDVKHHLLEPDFDLPPVGGEREGEVWAGGRWARQDGMSRDLGSCLPWLLFPDPQLPRCKTGTASSGFTPCTCPIFWGKYFCFTFTAVFSPFMPHFFVAAWPGKAGSHMHLLLDIGGWFLRQLLAQGLAFADAPRKLSLLESAPRHLPIAPGLSRGSAAMLRCQLSHFLGCFYYLCSHSSIIQRSLSFSEQLSQEAAARLAWATSTPGFAGCYF